jgi:uncharacterized protein YbaA (DUF1428 family)
MYVDGFVLPVPKKNLDAYRKLAETAGKVWREHGALDYVECVADDVKPGQVTSFPQSVKLEPDETVVFAWITYASRAERDRINELVMKDPRMTHDPGSMLRGGARPPREACARLAALAPGTRDREGQCQREDAAVIGDAYPPWVVLAVRAGDREAVRIRARTLLTGGQCSRSRAPARTATVRIPWRAPCFRRARAPGVAVPRRGGRGCARCGRA